MIMNIDPQTVLDTLLSRCKEHYSPCGQGNLIWREWGEKKLEKRPLILLHGGSGAWNHWTRTIPALENDFQLYAVDLPGCGDSADPPKPYDAESLVEIISSGVDSILHNDEAFDLISFSFGGVLSGLLAHSQARRIRSLTLVGSPILGLTGTGPANDLVEVPQGIPLREAVPLYKHNLQNLMLFKPEAIDDLALTIHVNNMSKARLRSRGIARTSVLADSLNELPCALTCIFGAEDTTLNPNLEGVREYVHSLHPNTEFHVIPESGHWVQFESSEKVNDILLKNFNRVQS